MKIDPPVEEGYFNITPVTFCDLDAYLITPEIDAKWNDKNLHFRSLIVSKDGTVLSSGFKKFFNKGEKPDCYPDPDKFNDWVLYDKIDGSCLICDYVNNKFSMRTRGAASYKKQENYKDFELLPKKYPQLVEFLKNNQGYSLLFEIVTPNNVIVVRPKEVDFYFLGGVDKNTMEMITNSELYDIWGQIGYPKLPERYHLDSKPTTQSLSNLVKSWKNKEGIVLVYNDGQNRIKLKSDWYLQLHRIKSQLNSIDNLIDYYIDNSVSSHEDFFKKVETEFDFEIASQLDEKLKLICQQGDYFNDLIIEGKRFLQKMPVEYTRKEKAEKILEEYSESGNQSFIFCILDNKKIPKTQIFKFIKNNITYNK